MINPASVSGRATTDTDGLERTRAPLAPRRGTAHMNVPLPKKYHRFLLHRPIQLYNRRLILAGERSRCDGSHLSYRKNSNTSASHGGPPAWIRPRANFGAPGGRAMLLWEHLARFAGISVEQPPTAEAPPRMSKRLPYDTRCAMVTKSGRRCKGRIRNGADFCALHDPAVAEKRRSASSKPRQSHPLSKLPDGYLRKLSTRASIGGAMDRLYREVRLGLVTPEMGNVLFGILTRLMDSGLLDQGRTPKSNRGRADRLRPKLADLLTRAERAAWERALAKAPISLVHDGKTVAVSGSSALSDSAIAKALARPAAIDQSRKLTLQAAS